MPVPKNKTEVVKFLVSQWKTDYFRSKLGQRLLYMTEDKLCWKISQYGSKLVQTLESSHEEADTRIILHAQHAPNKVLIYSDDTDVFVLMLSFISDIEKTYAKTGRGSSSRIIDLDKVKCMLQSAVQLPIMFCLVTMLLQVVTRYQLLLLKANQRE